MKKKSPSNFQRKTRNRSSYETLRPVVYETSGIIQIKKNFPDTISFWIAAYFRFEVTTSQSSQKVQHRDLSLFCDFMIADSGSDDRSLWSPRLSKAFADHLKKTRRTDRKRGFSDRTVNRILAHMKTFSRWIHKLKPFPLGDPMAKIKLLPVANGLEIERAISASERRRLLDAADLLPVVGGRSGDRNRYRDQERPQRKGYRAWRNRAIIVTPKLQKSEGFRVKASEGEDVVLYFEAPATRNLRSSGFPVGETTWQNRPHP